MSRHRPASADLNKQPQKKGHEESESQLIDAIDPKVVFKHLSFDDQYEIAKESPKFSKTITPIIENCVATTWKVWNSDVDGQLGIYQDVFDIGKHVEAQGKFQFDRTHIAITNVEGGKIAFFFRLGKKLASVPTNTYDARWQTNFVDITTKLTAITGLPYQFLFRLFWCSVEHFGGVYICMKSDSVYWCLENDWGTTPQEIRTKIARNMVQSKAQGIW